MSISDLKALRSSANLLYQKIQYLQQNSKYIYPENYRSWVDEFNRIIKKYNTISQEPLCDLEVHDSDFSDSQKTVRTSAVDTVLITVNHLSNCITTLLTQTEKAESEKTPALHQMRRCFKLGLDKCPQNPKLEKRRAFIAMPFNGTNLDSFLYGIKPALEQQGFDYYKADDEINTMDIMCKICKELQSCNFVIANISGNNPNVMFEYGIALGLGKKVFIVKDNSTSTISDLQGLEYIEYTNIHELAQRLGKALSSF